VLDLGDDGTVAAESRETGELRFLDEEREVHSRSDLERLGRDLTAAAARRTLLRLRLTGRVSRETLDEIDLLRARLEAAVLHLDFRTDQLREEITAQAIDREYPAGSFPHTLLRELAREDDQEALQIAHDFLQELKR
jgi:DNA repair protein SbcD/Mre11